MDIVLRATVIFFILFVLLRVLGKRQLGQMTPFEFVALVVLGDFVQQAVTHNDFSITAATLAVATFSFWSLALGWISYRSKRMRRVLEGEPRVLIHQGEFIEKVLERDKITRDEVLSEMRLAGIAHLAEVEWGILEPSGKISFLKRDGDQD
ncbi:DUF421 domain-containing protein [Sphingomonas sp. LY160]|uniref:DUF421 domain-containing protein n=1 Tax=Sphingomonas sp. LY160 TaxID=3095342 RepID=UPI002ADEBAB4|nr:DUF421 domain-containing protein [Sphingomonas sp. LY160]MEA1072657.1 DUF421 domain-containing protein [Sphingomonas sp. LY160]